MNTTNEQMECIMDLAYLTAARKEELLNIKLSDIRSDGLRISQNKIGKHRIFTWTPGLMAVIARAMTLRSKHLSTSLFANRNGTPFTTNGFQSMWRKYIQKEGFPGTRFHDIRIMSITDAERKHGRGFAQALAGHASGNLAGAYVRGNPNPQPLL